MEALLLDGADSTNYQIYFQRLPIDVSEKYFAKKVNLSEAQNNLRDQQFFYQINKIRK